MKKINFQYVLCYIFWLITSLFTLYLLLLSRGFYLKIMPFITRNLLVINFIDKLLFIVFAVIALGIIIGTEAYYKKGITQNILIQRFFYITGVEILFLFLLQHIPSYLYGISLNIFQLLIGFLELGLAIFLIYLSKKEKNLYKF